MIFADRQRIFELNFETEEFYTTVDLSSNPLNDLPMIFRMNNEQTATILCDTENCIYYNHRTRDLIDLDNLYQISRIKMVEYDEEDEVFYILANQFKMKFGLFLIKFDQNDLEK